MLSRPMLRDDVIFDQDNGIVMMSRVNRRSVANRLDIYSLKLACVYFILLFLISIYSIVTGTCSLYPFCCNVVFYSNSYQYQFH